jgi:hypothetical protein
MLDQIGTKPIYNNLSPELREKLNKKAAEAGRYVKYKFAIAKRNPDGEFKTGGEYLYPLSWSLTPVTFHITDSDGLRKKIGMVDKLKEFGHPADSFRRVKLLEQFRGILTLDMDNMEDQDMFAYLQLHPKLEGGMFRDKNEMAVFKHIDDIKEAKSSLSARENRANAMFVASQMAANEIKDFACAMGWNEHDDISIIRDRVMELADKDPLWFKNFIDNKSIEYRAVIKRSMDNNIIAWQPVENKFVWTSNGQTIAILDRCEDGKVLERMSDWIVTSKNGQETYTKLKGILFKNQVSQS